MDIRQKLMIGIIGLKEIVAKRDAEIAVEMFAGNDPMHSAETNELFVENRKVNELIEAMNDLMDNPIVDISIEALTAPKSK